MVRACESGRNPPHCLPKWLYHFVFQPKKMSIPVVIQVGVQWYLFDVEHIFICLCAICISSLVKCLLRFLAYFSHFLIKLFGVFFCCSVVSIVCTFWITVLLQLYALAFSSLGLLEKKKECNQYLLALV